MTPGKSERAGRQANWDLLRSISMFAVVVVHCGGPYLGQIGAVNLGAIVSRAAIACDPVFFALSGYFALRPLKRGLRDYYQRKLIGIVMPLVVYSVRYISGRLDWQGCLLVAILHLPLAR